MDTTNPSTLWKAGGAGFSSASAEWATPPAVFEALDEEFSFELDAAASPANSKCRRFYTAADNALSQVWRGVVWLNPPYGRGLGKWLAKAADSAEAGATVVCLVPARTDTQWWHEQVLNRASEVRLVRGRLRFGDADSSAPFPSAIVVYRADRQSLRITGWNRPEEVR